MNPHRFKRFAWVAFWLSLVAIPYARKISVSPVDAIAVVWAIVASAAFAFWIGYQVRVYWRWYRLTHRRSKSPKQGS